MNDGMYDAYLDAWAESGWNNCAVCSEPLAPAKQYHDLDGVVLCREHKIIDVHAQLDQALEKLNQANKDMAANVEPARACIRRWIATQAIRELEEELGRLKAGPA